MRGPLGNFHLPLANRRFSVPVGEGDSFEGGSSVASTNQVQNCTPLSLLNNSPIPDITQCVTSTQFTTQQWSINTPTTMPDTSTCSKPPSAGTSQTDSTHRIVSSPPSSIAITPTPLSSFETLPTPIPNPVACVIISIPPQIWATDRNQRQRQWQLQPQGVSTPQSLDYDSLSIHYFVHSDMTRLVFATGRLLELYMWNRQPFMSASDLEMVRYAMQPVAKGWAEPLH